MDNTEVMAIMVVVILVMFFMMRQGPMSMGRTQLDDELRVKEIEKQIAERNFINEQTRTFDMLARPEVYVPVGPDVMYMGSGYGYGPAPYWGGRNRRHGGHHGGH